MRKKLEIGGKVKCMMGLAFRDIVTLLEIVGLADSGMDLMVLFLFCYFFQGLGMLTGLN